MQRNKETKKAIMAHISALQEHQQTIFEIGHNFWHCATTDKEKSMPFWYYQKNKQVSMSTCGNCQKLMELRKQIRSLQRSIGVPQTPLKTNIVDENVQILVCINSQTSQYSPNRAFVNH